MLSLLSFPKSECSDPWAKSCGRCGRDLWGARICCRRRLDELRDQPDWGVSSGRPLCGAASPRQESACGPPKS